METVSVTRTIDAPLEAVRDRIADVEPFMLACGFDDVTVDGREIHIENRVGILPLELFVHTVDREGAALAYEHDEGIFDEMDTYYELEATDDGTLVTATTNFSLDVALVGELMEATVVKRQRRRELEAQFDWLEEQLA